MKWTIGIVLLILWILAVLFYLALFKGAARGDRFIEEAKKKDKEEDNKLN
ncbi:MAG: hypothetical protein ACRC41_07455 [Sarcina sp.]